MSASALKSSLSPKHGLNDQLSVGGGAWTRGGGISEAGSSSDSRVSLQEPIGIRLAVDANLMLLRPRVFTPVSAVLAGN